MFFTKMEKTTPKYIWNFKGPRAEKNKIGRLILPDFKTYYKATVLKIVWYWHNDIGPLPQTIYKN